jgi:hypothetical protein
MFETEKTALRKKYADRIESDRGSSTVQIEIFYGRTTPDNLAVVLDDGRVIDYTANTQKSAKDETVRVHNVTIQREGSEYVAIAKGTRLSVRELVSVDTVTIRELRM